jgi:hypothetical protein
MLSNNKKGERRMQSLDARDVRSETDPLESLTSIQTSNLIQEEADFADPFATDCCSSSGQHSSCEDKALFAKHDLEKSELQHRHHMEWMQAIRGILLPLLLSISAVMILLRLMFMLHDVDRLLNVLQTVLGLCGATASGYAFAQIRTPEDQKGKDKTEQPPDEHKI